MRNPNIAIDIYTSPKRHNKVLEGLWERFVSGEGGAERVREVVAASWTRCRSGGVHPLNHRAPIVASQEEIARSCRYDRLLQVAQPWLDEMKAASADSGHLVVIADASGLLLSVEGDRLVRRRAERMNFVPGARWAEATAGTNAIGTALATGLPVQIFAAEHWCQIVHSWTCSAAPVRDPVTGSLLGVIDLTGPFAAVHPHSLVLVTSVARAVEGELHREAEWERAAVIAAYSSARRQAQEVLAALDRGGRVLAGSDALMEEGLLDPNGRPFGLPEANRWLELGSAVEWDVEGRRGRYRCELRAVIQGGRVVGALMRAGAVSGRGSGTKALPRCRFEELMGQSEAFRRVILTGQQAAAHSLPVLILGESGTGKERLAQAIHAASSRAHGPFVAVNCGAIPRELVASEFFGYDPGSFTGASREGKPGKFELARGGTIFLDEIGEMPPDAQVHLLRVLEEREVVRIGGRAPIRLDIRVIAATSRDLEKAMREGTFRKDLFYRLSVVCLTLPPLRERRDDIPLLLDHFLRRACEELARPPLHVSSEALALLWEYPWPGNVRELRNVAYRLALQVDGPVVRPEHLPPEVYAASRDRFAAPGPPATHPAPAGPAVRRTRSLSLPVRSDVGTLEEQERELIRVALSESGGNVTAAARRLGIHRSTIYRKLS
ncbi:sigma-54-dependent Fis family transcriptional regulator [Caldinitratiruptor microaerophilus]|uniref:Sigma-54-dependent Fis family transcriptional regulator n=1 Tax=Caldinitratiruptor microaerophilus TaxID=671077 RepID=A0AA35CJT4_9FIRM|nr:sigma-54-dependent Fis family transcriptional regulator [Caldinitratiruptor microaerophilus]BDG60512.1 sigma-54-dependent Fis family transcriptional regulator [Caldinitratiruptor microaerophilus]